MNPDPIQQEADWHRLSEEEISCRLRADLEIDETALTGESVGVMILAGK